MNRVNAQIELEKVIDQARVVVKSKKELRDAVRLGIYRVGNRTFAVTDSTTAYEVKDGQLVALTTEEYAKYVRPENVISASYEFKVLTDKEIETLTKLFGEVK
jgi:hypothetical protein